MAEYTDSELLIKIREAIVGVLTGGQSYTIDGQTFNRGDLAKLYEMEKYYAQKAEGNSYPKFVEIGFCRRR